MEGTRGIREVQGTPEGQGAGLLDAAARVLRELLRTPRFKQAVKILLNSVDPESAPELARTLVWEDTDLFLSLLSTLPRLLNALVRLALELSEQLGNFTPDLLDAYLGRLLEEVDGESAGEALGQAASLVGRVREAGEAAEGSASRLLEAVVRGYARGIGREWAGGLSAKVALKAITAAVSGLLEAAESDDPAAREAALSFARRLADSVREHPRAARELAAPLLEAWKGSEGWS